MGLGNHHRDKGGIARNPATFAELDDVLKQRTSDQSVPVRNMRYWEHLPAA